MRILYFSVLFEFFGSESYITSEIKYLINAYPNTEFIVYSVDSKQNRVIRYDKNILWIQRRKLKNFKVILFFLRDMIIILTKFKPDIIHSVYVNESIIMGFIAKLFRIPSILHSRGTDFNFFSFISLKRNLLVRIANMLNNCIITVSETMRSDGYRLNIPLNKMITLYDGIEFSDFNPASKENDITSNKIFQILNIGRFSPEKCHDIIIESCKKLKENNFNFHMTFIGFGNLESQIKNKIKQYDLEKWITIVGFIKHENISQYLSKADLYIQPSLIEGMPIAVLEAMSMELPIIMTNIGGMRELNVESGVILIEKKNAIQLYNAIISFMNNREKMKIGGKKNRAFILKNFNWELHSKKLYNIYLELTKKKRFRNPINN